MISSRPDRSMDARNISILYVEDDPDASEMITILFRAIQPNFVVKAVSDENDALKAISVEKFDVYI
jgi:DNA-binding response OmpR family regulator